MGAVESASVCDDPRPSLNSVGSESKSRTDPKVRGISVAATRIGLQAIAEC